MQIRIRRLLLTGAPLVVWAVVPGCCDDGPDLCIPIGMASRAVFELREPVALGESYRVTVSDQSRSCTTETRTFTSGVVDPASCGFTELSLTLDRAGLLERVECTENTSFRGPLRLTIEIDGNIYRDRSYEFPGPDATRVSACGSSVAYQARYVVD